MAKFHSLLNLRFRQKEDTKTTALAERSNSGNLSSFAGIFRVNALNEKEKELLLSILQNYKSEEGSDVEKDLESLLSISSEVKAINNQAVILHGERIKKAQNILKNYKEGAFTAWLMVTYGNRQTPYNFLQYYEFYTSMPSTLHSKIDEMPRQAIYTLASRTGPLEKKEEIVKNYEGEPKRELLSLIRKAFPLPQEDKRNPNIAFQAIFSLRRLAELLGQPLFLPTKEQKKELFDLLSELRSKIDKKP